MPSFANLHAHTEYSLADGCQTIEEYLDRLEELNIDRAAITDTHNLFGAMEFHERALDRGIQPIIGVDLRLRGFPGRSSGGRPRVRVLIENDPGYRRICRLLSDSYRGRRDHGLTVPWQELLEETDGLFFLGPPGPGPENSPADPETIIGNLDRVLEEAVDLDRWFLELPLYRSLESREQTLLDAAEEREVPVIVTHPSYFGRPSDHEALGLRIAVQSNRKLDELPTLPEHRSHQWVAGPDDLSNWIGGRENLLEQTAELASRCHFEFDTHGVHLPEFPGSDDPEDDLRQRCWEQLDAKDPAADEDEIEERLERELRVIEQLGYAEYFLIVADMIAWAREQNIRVGPGRGSAAGSLVAYLLDITRVDPMRFDLLFERFLNPDRGEMPDIDVDFTDHRRDEVIEYLRQRYGEESVGHIITFGQMKARNTVRDVGRIREESQADRDRFASLIPAGSDRSLRELREEHEDLEQFLASRPEREEWFHQALHLEGLVRNASQHAAGILVVPGRLDQHMPLYLPDEENAHPASQFDMYAIEDLGYLKLDVLGLKTLTLLDRTLEEIDPKDRPDLESLPEPDEQTSRWLRTGSLEGIFQLETRGSRQLVRDLAPETLQDLTDCIALYRPGPLQSGIVDRYRERREGNQPVEYPHPDLEPILEDSFGLIIYQEQVMAIARRIGGLSWADSDRLRRAMGKKKSDLMNRYREQFVEGAVEQGYDRDWADDLFDTLANFAQYGFNRSHSAAYARITYQTAYLKAHHTAPFYAGLLSIRAKNKDRVRRIVHAMREDDVPLQPPDVNRSPADFTTENEAVRFGLRSLRHVGTGLAEAIERERTRSSFESLEDFFGRVPAAQLRTESFRSLAASGALASLYPERDDLIEGAEDLLQAGKRLYQERQAGQESLLGEEQTVSLAEQLPDADWSTDRLDQAEKRALGFNLNDRTGEPLANLQAWTVPGAPERLDQFVDDWTPPELQILVSSDGLRREDRETVSVSGWDGTLTVNNGFPAELDPLLLLSLQPTEDAFEIASVHGAERVEDFGIELRIGKDQSPSTLENLAELLNGHPGSTPVRLRLETGERTELLHLNSTVSPSTNLRERIHDRMSPYSTRLFLSSDSIS